MIEAIKYFIESSNIVGSVLSAGILYYMIIMLTKIVRIEEKLKEFSKIEKIEDNVMKIIKNLNKFPAIDERIKAVDKRVDKVEKDVEELKQKI